MVTLVVIHALLAEKPIDGYKNLTRDIYMVHNSTRAIGTNKKRNIKKCGAALLWSPAPKPECLIYRRKILISPTVQMSRHTIFLEEFGTPEEYGTPLRTLVRP